MTAKEWRRRVNRAVAAKTDGDDSPLSSLCGELERLTEPAPVAVPLSLELKAVPPAAQVAEIKVPGDAVTVAEIRPGEPPVYS